MTTPAHLCNRSFAVWLIASAQSQLGSALAGIALSFLVLNQTGQAGAMAITLACALGPNLLMPLSGAWVDRLPLKVPLIAADLLRGALQLTVALLALNLGHLPLWVINGAALLGGFAGIFASPASSAALPQLVPEDQLARANGLFGSVSQGAWLIGTLAGGVLVARLGPPIAILIDGFSFLIMAALLPLVKLPGRNAPVGPRPGLLADLGAGLQLMRRSRVLSFVPLIGFAINAASVPLSVIMPKLMLELGEGAQGYGYTMALESVGMIAAGGLVAALGSRLPGKRTSGFGLLLLGLAFLLMASSPTYPVLLAGSLVVGISISLINIPLMTLMQQMVPAAFLGRVFGVLGMASSIGMPITLLLVSPVLDRYPAGLFYSLAGALMLAGCAAWMLVARSEPVPPDLSERPTGALLAAD